MNAMRSTGKEPALTLHDPATNFGFNGNLFPIANVKRFVSRIA
jgi:hypothetical protein